MSTIPKLKELGKRERGRVLLENRGLLERVAKQVGVTPETVSRVFHGKIARSPKVVAALEHELAVIFSAPGIGREGRHVA